jgi:hypothetical protein
MTITIPDIIHRPVSYLKHSVSETGSCLRIHVEPTQLGHIHTGGKNTGDKRANSKSKFYPSGISDGAWKQHGRGCLVSRDTR